MKYKYTDNDLQYFGITPKQWRKLTRETGITYLEYDSFLHGTSSAAYVRGMAKIRSWLGVPGRRLPDFIMDGGILGLVYYKLDGNKARADGPTGEGHTFKLSKRDFKLAREQRLAELEKLKGDPYSRPTKYQIDAAFIPAATGILERRPYPYTWIDSERLAAVLWARNNGLL